MTSCDLDIWLIMPNFNPSRCLGIGYKCIKFDDSKQKIAPVIVNDFLVESRSKVKVTFMTLFFSHKIKTLILDYIHIKFGNSAYTIVWITINNDFFQKVGQRSRSQSSHTLSYRIKTRLDYIIIMRHSMVVQPRPKPDHLRFWWNLAHRYILVRQIIRCLNFCFSSISSQVIAL